MARGSSRSSSSRSKSSSRKRSSGKKFIKSAIKRPGALSARAKRSGRSTLAQARKDKRSGTTLQKRQANFYLNVLKPASAKRKGTGRKKK
jgi:hypothetical protein